MDIPPQCFFCALIAQKKHYSGMPVNGSVRYAGNIYNMLKKIKITTCCLVSMLLQSCFHSSDESTDDLQTTKLNYTQNDLGQYSDASGDAAFDFIDLTTMVVTINDTTIKIEINLLNLPNEFSFNQINTPDDALEYGWQIFFDVDLDSTKANDVSFAINSFKFPESTEAVGELLTFTQKNAWLGSVDDSGFTVISKVNVSAGVSGSTLTMSVAKNSDNSISIIDVNTPIRFETVYNVSGVIYKDTYPEL